jgi:hypothetical protein
MALSMDFREKVMRAIRGGDVAPTGGSLVRYRSGDRMRWAKRVEITGEVALGKMGGDRRSLRIKAYADFILAQMRDKPAMTIMELRDKIRERPGLVSLWDRAVFRCAMGCHGSRARTRLAMSGSRTGKTSPRPERSGSKASSISIRKCLSSSTRQASRRTWPRASADEIFRELMLTPDRRSVRQSPRHCLQATVRRDRRRMVPTSAKRHSPVICSVEIAGEGAPNPTATTPSSTQRRAAFLIAIILSTSTTEAGEMKRGINVNPWFTRPAHGPDGGYIQPPFPTYDHTSFRGDLETLRQAGFDFVRMPVNSQPLLDASPAERAATLANLRVVVHTALGFGFRVLFDLHPPTTGKGSYLDLAASPSFFDRWSDLIEDVSREVVGKNIDRVIVEPLNEPTAACTDMFWESYQVRLITRLRRKFPDVKYTVTSACYSAVTSFVKLDLSCFAKDENIYATFHYYSPFVFTHQGASWTGNPGVRVMSGLSWPASLGDVGSTMNEVRRFAPTNFYYNYYGEAALDQATREAENYYRANLGERDVVEAFSMVGRRMDEQGFPRSRVILGEFGVLKRERRWNGASIDSAARWISAVRRAAEAEGFAWAMWSYKEGMALTVNDGGTTMHLELIQALGLSN